LVKITLNFHGSATSSANDTKQVMYGLSQRLVPKTNLHLRPELQIIILGSSKLNVLVACFHRRTKLSYFWAETREGTKSMGVVGKFGGRHSCTGKPLHLRFREAKNQL